MSIDKKKYEELLLYILTKSSNKPNFGKTVLCTLLYFIDFSYYELYGKLLTKETYIKSKKGIKPKHFDKITNELISKKQLVLKKKPYYNRIIKKYYPTILPYYKFSANELEIINLSYNKLSSSNATTLTKYIKNDPPLIFAEFGEDLNYKHVFKRENEYSMREIKLKK